MKLFLNAKSQKGKSKTPSYPTPATLVNAHKVFAKSLITRDVPKVTLGILDSAIDFSHPAFNNTSYETYMFDDSNIIVNNSNINASANLHGSSTASIICGEWRRFSKKKIYFGGIAPKVAKIIGFDLISCGGNIDKISAAIKYLIDKKQINILHIGYSFKSNPTLEAAIKYAVSANCIVCCAAGVGEFDMIKEFPATMEKVISVGYVDNILNPGAPKFDDTIIYAPGKNILAVTRGGTVDYLFNESSAASAFVSGAIVLLLHINPKFTYSKIKEILFESADQIENKPNYRFLNVYKAVQLSIKYKK